MKFRVNVIFCILLTFSFFSRSFCIINKNQLNEIRNIVDYPKYVIDLNKPPFERWNQLAISKSKVMKQALDYFIKDTVPEDITKLIEFISNDLESYLPKMYADEIKGIAHYANLKTSDIVFLNLIYEASAFCTSIISVDNKNQIWHARNLDFGNNANQTLILRNLTTLCTFAYGNQTIYTSISIAGYVGIHTGIKHGVFSVSLNERNRGNWMENLIAAIEEIIIHKSILSVGIVIRDSINRSPTFDDAVTYLSNQPLIAPSYFIVGGVRGNEGVVITRNRREVLDVYQIDLNKNRWYILETNYDRWTPAPPDDNRRYVAHKAMNTMGRRKITSNALMKVLSTPLVCNNHTVFSVVMSAADSNVFQLIVRN